MPEQIHFLDTDLKITTKTELWEAIGRGETVRIATENPEHLLEARHNPGFRKALSSMTHCTIDGSGLLGLLKFGRRKLKIKQPLELYHGSDLAEDLIQAYKDGSKRFYLLGGLDDAAVTAATFLQAKYPSIEIVGALGGGKIDRKNPYSEELGRQIAATKPDILLVGFGAPRQELWIQAAKDLPIQIMVGVGGTFNFYGGKDRAPQFMRSIHMEWLYRSLTEPGHLKRAMQAVFIFPVLAFFWILAH